MTGRNWWDIAVAGLFAIVVPVAVAQSEITPAVIASGVISCVLIAGAYVVFARPELSDAAPPWRLVAFTAAGAAGLAVGVAGVPFLATMQVVLYPLAWVIASSRRPAIASSIVFGAAAFVGFAVGGGFSFSAVLSGVLTAVFSVALSLGFGLWIESIAVRSEERGRLVAQLELAQSEIASLARERGAAAERERLARDIHDTLAQTLAGLVILAERAGRQSREGESDAAATTIATVEHVARDALSESRALVARTAAVPAEPVFAAAVERLAERFRSESGHTIDVDLTGLDPASATDREAQVVALRCVQEALSNVRKHAGATRVSVSVAGGDGIRLAISDDGRGFDPAAPRHGYGLDGMRDRLALAGGTLEIESAPGAGTTVRIGIPAGSEVSA